jgi:hypothetical protein
LGIERRGYVYLYQLSEVLKEEIGKLPMKPGKKNCPAFAVFMVTSSADQPSFGKSIFSAFARSYPVSIATIVPF